MAQQLTESLQEAVLAVLAFDKKHGALISAQVQPENFDGVYHEVASAVLRYRRKYSNPPGKAHLEDLFSSAQLDPSDRRTHVLRRTLVNLSAIAESLNAEYVASRAQDFVREQKLKSALFAANERYLQGGDDTVPEVEGILHSALRFREQTLDAGTFMNDTERALEFLTKQDDFISLGIPYFDYLGLGLIEKQLLLYIAPKGSGKTWLCCHAGRQALLARKKVLHVTLEMDEGRTLARYYQGFFGIARRPGAFQQAVLEFDELERLAGFKLRQSKPKLDFRDPQIRKILKAKVQHWGARFERLVIKHFPAGTLTFNQLRGYLDYLELVHKFIPQVLIIDYPFLMKLDGENLRISFGKMVVDIRGLLDERNMAGVIPTQSNRSGIGAKNVGSTNASEDISTVFTADTVISYSQTRAEKRMGLARLSLEHAREMESGNQLLISQAYATGQYVTGSALVSNAYWEQMKDKEGGEAIEE